MTIEHIRRDAGGRRPSRALLISNRHAGTGLRGLDAASDYLQANGIQLADARCDTAPGVSPCITAHRDRVDCVIVAGGDGTLNAACAGLMATGLPLGVLPLGTANDFARSAAIPLDPVAAARVITEGFTRRVDVGDVNGCPFFNVASVGLAADLVKSLSPDRKRRFGRLSYALTAGHALAKATPFHATLLVGREKVMIKTLQIAVGNGRYYGGGNVIAIDARIDAGFLDLYSLEFSQVWRMALLLPSFPRGAHGAMRGVRTARAETFEVITRKPRPVNADGELVTQTPAIFTQRKRAIGVYVPEACPLVSTGAPS